MITNRFKLFLSLAGGNPYKFEKELREQGFKDIEEGKIERELKKDSPIKVDLLNIDFDIIFNNINKKINYIKSVRLGKHQENTFEIPIFPKEAEELNTKFKNFFNINFNFFDIQNQTQYENENTYTDIKIVRYNPNKIKEYLINAINNYNITFHSNEEIIKFIDENLDISNFESYPHGQRGHYYSRGLLDELSSIKRKIIWDLSETFPKCFERFNFFDNLSICTNLESINRCQNYLDLFQIIENQPELNSFTISDDSDLSNHIDYALEKLLENYLEYYVNNKFNLIFGKYFEETVARSNVIKKDKFWFDNFNKLCQNLIKFKDSYNPELVKLFFNKMYERDRNLSLLLNLESFTEEDIKNLILNPYQINKNLKKSNMDDNKIKELIPLFNNLNIKNKGRFIKGLLSYYNGEYLYQVLTENFEDLKELVSFLIEYMMNAWNKDVNFAENIPKILIKIPLHFIYYNSSYSFFLIKIIKELNPKNEEQLISIFYKFKDFENFIHNNCTIELKDSYDLFMKILKFKYDLKQDSFKKCLKIVAHPDVLSSTINYGEFSDIFIDNFKRICNNFNYNDKEAFQNLRQVVNSFLDGTLKININIINKLNNILDNLNLSEALEELIPLKKDKSKKLYMLNYTINNNLKFEVLPNNSIEYFTVGSDTNCCQRLGGAGQDACKDSYINPLAGVLVLKGLDGVIAQSYFHYVPQDNGIILDNVEINENLVKKYNLNLNKLYFSLAKQVAQDYNLSYFKCGMAYNNLDNTLFNKSKMESDPRHFEWKEQYSDFSNHKHLDVLSPLFESTENEYILTKQASKKINNMYKLAALITSSNNYELICKIY